MASSNGRHFQWAWNWFSLLQIVFFDLADQRGTADLKQQGSLGPVSPESVEAAAREAGLDLERARADAASDEIAQELARNHALAGELCFTGTPSWVTKDRAFEGAVGYGALKEALEPGDS